MKFLVLTYGTDGDTRPLAALSRALMDAGHEAHLLADGATLGTATALGVPATAIAGDMRKALRHDGAAAGLFEKNSANDTAKELARIANENAEDWLRSAVQFGKGCDVIIISGLAGFVGLSAAEYLGAKPIGTGMFPLTPTAAFPSPFLPAGKLPRMFNRLSQQLINNLLWRAFRKATNEARARVCGLPPQKSLWVGHPMLYGVSPSLLPRPDDWPSNALICGQWLLPAVVVPFAGDQAFWAERLYQAGVAAKRSSWKALNAATLAESIRFAERTEVRSRARALGEKMRTEDGLKTAVQAIETLVA